MAVTRRSIADHVTNASSIAFENIGSAVKSVFVTKWIPSRCADRQIRAPREGMGGRDHVARPHRARARPHRPWHPCPARDHELGRRIGAVDVSARERGAEPIPEHGRVVAQERVRGRGGERRRLHDHAAELVGCADREPVARRGRDVAAPPTA
jgi:hypothetical protein